jgi:FkbM family methyltransferase
MKRFIKRIVRGFLYRLFTQYPALILSNPKTEKELFRISIPLKFVVGGREIVVPVDNQRHRDRWQRLQDRSKERDTIDWITHEMNEGSVFYDIGANVGNYSVLAGILHRGARVLAFEPEPNSFLALCRVIHTNGIQAVPYPFALSNRTEVQQFKIHHAFETALANHQLGRDINQHEERFEAVFSVGAVSFTMDSLVEDYGLPAPTHVKIDVDGLEPEVIEGMEKTLLSGTIKSVITEISGKKATEKVIDMFDKAAYRTVRNGESADIDYDKVTRLIFRRS